MVADAPELDGPEHIVCDSSFVSLVELSQVRPGLTEHWPMAVRERLDNAVLATTVFVLGEIRSGRVRANWGQARIETAERAIAAYLFVPLDFDVVDAYVEIRARHLHEMGDNDMWIAATAKAREWPLVTCDLHFCHLEEEIDLIYLPRTAESPSECP